MRCCAAAAALFSLCSPADPPAQDRKETVEWSKDLMAAYKQAVEGPKILVVRFTTDWCLYCKKQEEDYVYTARMKPFRDRAVLVELNPEIDSAGADLCKSLDITGYPSISVCHVTRQSITEIGRVAGYHAPETTDKLLTDFFEKAEQKKKDGSAKMQPEKSDPGQTSPRPKGETPEATKGLPEWDLLKELRKERGHPSLTLEELKKRTRDLLDSTPKPSPAPRLNFESLGKLLRESGYDPKPKESSYEIETASPGFRRILVHVALSRNEESVWLQARLVAVSPDARKEDFVALLQEWEKSGGSFFRISADGVLVLAHKFGNVDVTPSRLEREMESLRSCVESTAELWKGIGGVR
jgi:hypothetical protein